MRSQLCVCMDSNMMFYKLFALVHHLFCTVLGRVMAAAAVAAKKRVKVTVPKIMCIFWKILIILIIIARMLFVETIEIYMRISFNCNPIIMLGKFVTKPICCKFNVLFYFNLFYFPLLSLSHCCWSLFLVYMYIFMGPCVCVLNTFFFTYSVFPFCFTGVCMVVGWLEFFFFISFDCNILLLLCQSKGWIFRRTAWNERVNKYKKRQCNYEMKWIETNVNYLVRKMPS